MKTISLRLPESLLTELEQRVEQVSTSRNRYINDAIAFYNHYLERRTLAEQFAAESQLVGEDSLQVLAEFEMLEDGLD